MLGRAILPGGDRDSDERAREHDWNSSACKILSRTLFSRGTFYRIRQLVLAMAARIISNIRGPVLDQTDQRPFQCLVASLLAWPISPDSASGVAKR